MHGNLRPSQRMCCCHHGDHYRAKYARTLAERPDLPPLPDRDAVWSVRGPQIAALAIELHAEGWTPYGVCGLLRELGVHSQMGLAFDPEVLKVVRRTCRASA